jgi:hypothetical protein
MTIDYKHERAMVHATLNNMKSEAEKQIQKFKDYAEERGIGQAIRWNADDAIQAELILKTAKRIEEGIRELAATNTDKGQVLAAGAAAREILEEYKDALLDSDLTSSNCTCEYSNARDRSDASAMRKLIRDQLDDLASRDGTRMRNRHGVLHPEE